MPRNSATSFISAAPLRAFARAILVFLLIAAVTRLFRAAEADSEDFRVYWRAVNVWWQGGFPYRIDAADQGFVFKYPPWMLPLFIPFTWLGFDFSKAVWAGLEFLGLGYCVLWLTRNGISRAVAFTTLALFWYIWLAHFYAGQFTLALLVCGLWVASAHRREDPFVGGVVSTLFVSKVFSAYSLFGNWRRLLRPAVIGWAVGILAVSQIFLLVEAQRAGTPFFGTLVNLYHGFSLAAGSGSSGLGAEVVRGTGNHGFTAMILRVIDPEARRLSLDIAVSVALALFFGTLWARASRPLRFEESWAGWLALGAIAHPLAWHHSFVMAFPLCAYSLQAAVELPREERKRIWMIALSLLAIALIGLLVPQVVGKTVVKPFELLSNKSWGVVLSSAVLVLSRRRAA